MRTFMSAVIVLLVIAVIPNMTTGWAQEDTTPAPTFAPPKTATPTTVVQAIEPTAQVTTEASSTALTEPLTQADLNILTGNVQRPNGLAWFNNKLYTACNGDYTVYELDDRTGASVTYIYGVRNMHALYPEQDANGGLVIWAPDFQSNTFVRVTRSGVETISQGLQGPWGIGRIDDNSFVVSNITGDNVVSITRTGGMREAISNMRSPTGIAVDGEYVYIANNGSARRAVEWFNLSALSSPTPVDAESTDANYSLITGLQNPTGLALGTDGYLYVAYSLGTRGVVGRVNPATCRENGGCTNDQVEIVLYTELAAPLAGLTLSPDMRLFVHTMFSPDIYWAQVGEPAIT